MVGVLIASLKDFVNHNHLSNAFKTFIHIQHHASNSSSNASFDLIFQPIRDLLSACTNLKSLQQGDAQSVTENSNSLDPLHWNMVISLYVRKCLFDEAISVYRKMLIKGVKPDDYTYPSVLKACGELLDYDTGVEGIEMNVIIWNTIAGVHLHKGNFKEALEMLSQMRVSIHLDSVAMVVGLNACSNIKAVKLGKEIHGHAIRTCFDVFDNVKNALITMYSRCGDLNHAYMLFRKMDEKGLITWNAMLSGFAHMNRAEEVSFLFREMLHEGVEPNFVTIASVLPLCARIENIQHGKEFHCYMVKRQEQFGGHLLLWNSLVEMYSSEEFLSPEEDFEEMNVVGNIS
ncbi:hypothetical protein TSUD_229660 [Trifolium subterraneum]|uniref:Pentatricopeptide repeat-containing protein n=1 Tax=Trifolium subterraneum TaxID=3900 RepID=A0A2Z6LGI5_TRISU|nr:hypothetical protein TSUD_229660 [Trifolium subterraneum]